LNSPIPRSLWLLPRLIRRVPPFIWQKSPLRLGLVVGATCSLPGATRRFTRPTPSLQRSTDSQHAAATAGCGRRSPRRPACCEGVVPTGPATGWATFFSSSFRKIRITKTHIPGRISRNSPSTGSGQADWAGFAHLKKHLIFEPNRRATVYSLSRQCAPSAIAGLSPDRRGAFLFCGLSDTGISSEFPSRSDVYSRNHSDTLPILGRRLLSYLFGPTDSAAQGRARKIMDMGRSGSNGHR